VKLVLLSVFYFCFASPNSCCFQNKERVAAAGTRTAGFGGLGDCAALGCGTDRFARTTRSNCPKMPPQTPNEIVLMRRLLPCLSRTVRFLPKVISPPPPADWSPVLRPPRPSQNPQNTRVTPPPAGLLLILLFKFNPFQLKQRSLQCLRIVLLDVIHQFCINTHHKPGFIINKIEVC